MLKCLIAIVLFQSPTELDRIRSSFAKQIEAVRSEKKLPALKRNPKLDAAAQKHAENMARQAKVAHVLDGKGPPARIIEEGYFPGHCAENIVSTGPDKSGMTAVNPSVAGLRNSPGHYRNIINAIYLETGVGVATDGKGQWYFCQVFGTEQKK